MLSSVRLPIVTSYSVEVSGWDAAQTFFVERAELEWSEETGKHVHLRRSLRDGSLLFIRLIRSNAAPHSHPVPYEAESLGTNHKGRFGFRLHPVLPNGIEDGRRGA
ncbi:MAG TPA: hypothetical protein VLV88_11990 [Terriglobales bacterium]|nr:hypothetical protein [Terriglobales bacterium]